MPISQFEQHFSDIAYSFLQEKALGLIEHLIGFEVVKKNDKGTKALGLFAFKLGDDYLYAPVFFINGEIKPLELLYLKNKDLFIPLDEEWVSYLLKKEPLVLGEPTDQKKRQFDQPDFDLFATPPITGKHVTASLNEKTYKTLDYLSECSNDIKRKFLEKLSSDKALLEETIKAYGVDYIKEACEWVPEKKAAEQVQEVQVITPEDAESIRNLDLKTKKKVYVNKVVVKDDRPQEKVSKLYQYQYTDKLQNPQQSGVYQLIDIHGSLVEALVLLTPMGREMYGSPKATVIEVETGRFVCAPVNKIWVKDNYVVDDYEGLFKKLKVIPRSAGKIGECYVLVNRKLSSSCPFMIKRLVKDSAGLLNYIVEYKEGEVSYPVDFLPNDWSSERDVHHEMYRKNTYKPEYRHMRSENKASLESGPFCDSGEQKLVLSPRGEKDDSGLYMLSDELVIPANFSLIPLQEPDYKQGVQFALGTAGSVMNKLVEMKMNRLRVKYDGSEYFVSYNKTQEKPLDKVSAVKVLVNKYQVAGDDALDLLKEAESRLNNPISVLIKLAQPGPHIPDPTLTSNSGIPHHTQYLNEELIPSQETYPTPPDVGDPTRNLYTGPAPGYPDMDMSLAMQAAQSGQQTVFDHAALASLVRLTGTTEIINKYIPDLEKALDRIGRLLFMFWWRNEDFQELFGITSLTELEDLLRSVFKSFGELILELKKKEKARMPLQ